MQDSLSLKDFLPIEDSLSIKDPLSNCNVGFDTLLCCVGLVWINA